MSLGLKSLSSAMPGSNDAPGSFIHEFSPDDLILYALSVGATTSQAEDLKYLYEGHEEFTALPSYAVIPSLAAFTDSNFLRKVSTSYNIDFNPSKLFHGEQYLELYRPLPSTGTLKTTARVVDVLDKGSGAVVIMAAESCDAESGEKVSYSQTSAFVIGAGNFGGKKTSDNQEVKPVIPSPNRPPDMTTTEKTSVDQAALYRLNGDKNPLHIDPKMAEEAGFDRPILHGLCTFGFVTRHVIKMFADSDSSQVKCIKARFANSLYPGETLKTEAWKEEATTGRILFQSKSVESDKVVVTGGYIDLFPSDRDDVTESR